MATGRSVLRLGSPAELRPAVAVMPLATTLSLVADAVAGRPQGVPPGWRQLVRGGLPADAAAVLAPLFRPGTSVLPDCLTPSVLVGDRDLDEHLDRVVAAATDRLDREVEQLYGPHPPAAWRAVLAGRARWVGRYALVLRAGWAAFRPVWRRAERLIDHEIGRIGTAAVRGALDGVLAGLGQRWQYTDGTLSVADPEPTTIELAGRRLVLVPSVSGAGAALLGDTPDLVWLGYPPPGLAALYQDTDAAPPNPDLLGTVLGPLRARILRAAGPAPSMGQLAGVLNCPRPTVTYHCTQLVQAHLLERHRHGKQVHIRRTQRGDALLDLLA
jgi:hypothetical protein